MFAYYPIRSVYHGYGQAAELLGTALTAAMAIYQEDARRRAAKQAEHQAARDRAAALEIANANAAAAQAHAYSVANSQIATNTAPPGSPGTMPALTQAGGMTTGMKVGLGVGAAALLVGGVMVMR
jgi:hypothetical protein